MHQHHPPFTLPVCQFLLLLLLSLFICQCPVSFTHSILMHSHYSAHLLHLYLVFFASISSLSLSFPFLCSVSFPPLFPLFALSSHPPPPFPVSRSSSAPSLVPSRTAVSQLCLVTEKARSVHVYEGHASVLQCIVCVCVCVGEHICPLFGNICMCWH